MNVGIRAERNEDEAAIAAVHTGAFGGSEEARLVELLRARSDFIASLSLVAVSLHRKIVGHILFHPIQIQPNRGGEPRPALALAPLGVAPAMQGRGVGSSLVCAGLAKIRAQRGGPKPVLVLGDPNYYRRFGFDAAVRYRVASPFAVRDENFMLWLRSPNDLDRVASEVVYPSEFATV